MVRFIPVTLSVVISLHAAQLVAQETDSQAMDLDKVYITGGADDINRQPGSAMLIDDVALEEFEYTDIHRVLNSVPGVNLQEEDGYGLRPNIGLRGTPPERSKKVTVMEDGVLSGPAPYSAPAAYYFPNVSRMSAVEVFKGPATTQYGPATIGGAINLVSRPIPYQASGELDLQYGQYNFQRANAFYGQQIADFGYLLEGLHLSTDGFKELDGDGDTGFVRNDLNVKTSWQSHGAISQLFQLKLGYADENSDETYLGLTRADFDADPYRRYAASQLDNMEWQHNQIHFTHLAEINAFTSLTTDVYHNTFQRDWFKLNAFNTSSTSLQDIMKDPGRASNPDFYDVLTGQRASSGDSERLKIGNNGREFISQGIQTKLNHSFTLAGLDNQLEVGLRFHQDQIERHHTEQLYAMQNGGSLIAEGELYSTTRNKGEAEALAIYVKDDVIINDTTITLGLRSEQIETSQTTYDPTSGALQEKVTSNESVLLPGIGFYSQLNHAFGILAGVHKGYSATAPGNDGDVDPEESTNFEAGVRFNGDFKGEVIAFLNDYSQLTGTCSFSNGCDNSVIDSQTNAGEASVYGIESMVSSSPELAGLILPLSLSYTYTQAEFGTNFRDDNGAFGEANNDITKGDELAYLPKHRLNAKAGIQKNNWKVHLSALYQSDMRDTPGQGTIADEEKIAAYTVFDLAASLQVLPELQVYGTIDNLSGEEYVVASNPYGYRPGKRQSVNMGIKFKF